MDDRNFDKKSADDWISAIEGEGALVRDEDIYPHLKKWLWDNDLIKVVDLGAGQGVCSTKVPENTLYTGVEPSLHLLARARENFPETVFLEGSAYRIPVADGSQDGVFSIAVWHLLSDPDLAAREVSRVLRPLGHFLIITADPDAPAWKNSSEKLYMRSEQVLTRSWEKVNLRVDRMGVYRHFWYFEGRKLSP